MTPSPPHPGSGEQFAEVGELTLCFETFGDADAPTVLLVMGIASQMVSWNVDLCMRIADAGFHVVRYDNRDVGRSSKVDAPTPGGMLNMLTGRGATYTIVDMAADAIGLLDHLDVARAHVVGISMGGMIAQQAAIDHQSRVRSLTSMASTPGQYHHGRPTALALRGLPTPTALRGLLKRSDHTREAYLAAIPQRARDIRAVVTAEDLEDAQRSGALAWDRGIDLRGFARQFAAVSASPDRRRPLRSVEVPTLVLHGDRDPIFPLVHAQATAAAVPGADLVVVPGLGHGLPRSMWDQILPPVIDHLQGTEGRAGSRSTQQA